MSCGGFKAAVSRGCYTLTIAGEECLPSNLPGKWSILAEFSCLTNANGCPACREIVSMWLRWGSKRVSTHFPFPSLEAYKALHWSHHSSRAWGGHSYKNGGSRAWVAYSSLGQAHRRAAAGGTMSLSL